MTTDPNGWFLTSQALDHRATVEALTGAVPPWLAPDIASTPEGLELAVSDIVTGLARAGYALVRLTPDQEAHVQDLSPFLSRRED
jgi:hypothetical protein